MNITAKMIVVFRMSYISAVNQPDIVNLSSKDDAAPTNTAPPVQWVEAHVGFFDSFRIDLETPVLGAKGVLLTSASVPSTGLNIPDYQMAFGFYKVALVVGQPPAGAFTNPANFHYMVANSYNLAGGQAVAPYVTPFKNQPLATYTDMAAWLNEMVAANVVLLGDPVLAELTFVYDAVMSKIYIETPAAQAGFAYQVALPGDPNLIAAVDNYKAAILPGGNGDLDGRYSLSSRVGFAYSVMSPVLLDGVCVIGGGELYPNSAPDLVFTQNVNVRSSIAQGSSVSSNNDHDLLAVLPVPAPPLGVSLYQAKTENPLRRVAPSIFQVDIQLTDDNDEPFYLPDNAIVNVELHFLYK